MISQATIIGRSHRLMQQNCHDFVVSGSPQPDLAYGLVLDGCGSKYRAHDLTTPSHNEVGAKLLGQFAARFFDRRLPETGEQSDEIVALCDDLYQGCLGFLEGLVSLLSLADEGDRACFVATHLLSTLVGFVVTGKTAVFFWAGDGYLGCNGEITSLDSDNRPDYLTYRLFDATPAAFGFCYQIVPDREKLAWLTVATDGWQAEQLAQLAERRSSLSLQRWANVQARQRGCFEDDGAVALWWGE